jgi:hypothetical protein
MAGGGEIDRGGSAKDENKGSCCGEPATDDERDVRLVEVENVEVDIAVDGVAE